MISDAKLLTATDLYMIFKQELESYEPHSWHLCLFEGSPAEGLYSWCPDCLVALPHFEKFENEVMSKPLNVKLAKFKVGSRAEWEGKDPLNPFKKNFPFLSDVPTSILFLGRIDVYRVVAPEHDDFTNMVQRAQIYQRQIAEGNWHPPIESKAVRKI